MSATLYRKYRPTKFSEIVDENHVKITLQRAVAQNKIAHAYLFTGPRGVGKTTTARILAKAVNCLNPQAGEPCNKCDICQRINQGNFLDLVELDAASRRRIDEIREFKELIKYPPNQAKYKVFIIDEVHMLTDVSFNALLKTIEEPPAYTIFILCTTEVHKVPATIISRCQRFDFKKIPVKDIVNNLNTIAKQEGIKIADEVLYAIAKHADGCLRDAQSLLGQILVLSEGKQDITADDISSIIPQADAHLLKELWQGMVNKDKQRLLELVASAYESGLSMELLMDNLIEFVHLLLVYKINQRADEIKIFLPEDDLDEVIKSLQLVDVVWVKRALDILLKYKDTISLSPLSQLPLELALIEIVTDIGDDSEGRGGGFSQFVDKGAVDNTSSSKSQPEVNSKQTKQTSSKQHAQQPTKMVVTAEIWSDLVNKIKDSNFSLAGLLKQATIVNQDNERLTLAVKYQIHQEIITKKKNLEIIQSHLKNNLGYDIKIDVIIDKNVSPVIESDQSAKGVDQNSASDAYSKEAVSAGQTELIDDVDQIISAFGGRVVESGVIEE